MTLALYSHDGRAAAARRGTQGHPTIEVNRLSLLHTLYVRFTAIPASTFPLLTGLVEEYCCAVAAPKFESCEGNFNSHVSQRVGLRV